MRKILIASLIVAGIGFVGASATSAAPVNNTVLQQLTDMKSTVTQVGWHNPWRSRWRWGHRHWHCGPYSRWC
jgi:hypothetical protein